MYITHTANTTAAATSSASTDYPHNTSTQGAGMIIEEEDTTQLCVNTVRIVKLNTNKHRKFLL